MINSSNQRFTTGYRAVLTGVFVGIADALISLVYNIVYRSGGADFPQALINVSYLIFGTVFLFFLIGVVYMSLQLFTKRASLLFIILFAALTIIFYTAASGGHFADSPVENMRYRGMLKGLVLIMGISATAGIPFLYHNRKFEEFVA